MNTEKFWQLISHIDLAQLRAGADAEAVEPLVDALSELAPAELRSFEDHLARALYALDGESFARLAGQNGESGDGFLYCRCFVVAQGKAHYEAVLAGRSPMPRSLDDWCEPLLSSPARAWARRTGSAAEDWDHDPAVSYETGSNEALWPPVEPVQERDPFDEPVLERAVSRAGHQFRSACFANVVKLLAPHEKNLSGRLAEMLRQARERQ